MAERAAIELTGAVQGVGFRPFVYALATSLDLHGFVQNRGAHLFVDVEGETEAMSTFLERLVRERPAHSAIDGVRRSPLPPASRRGFVIADSEMAGVSVDSVPRDVGTCDACLAELFNPANRRYRHPFIACAACGPRYSMLARLPFDRCGTAMASYALCAACAREYGDPRDRRFHAQATNCPACGPRLALVVGRDVGARSDAAARMAAARLAAGEIVAVKGIGGFHLACDATNDAAVARLRYRKRRDGKPLAVMLPPADGRALASALDNQRALTLLSPTRPIVLLDRELVVGLDRQLSARVAPDCPCLGVFLPYTPVHHLLLADVARPLVMTSGNRCDEPMAIEDDQAFAQLGEIADCFLTHDRPILRRSDDSVLRISAGSPAVVRLGRGLAPAAIALAETTPGTVLGVGADLKNAFCLLAAARAYLSPHVGNIESLAGLEWLTDAVSQLVQLLQLEPTVIAHDLHPDLLSSRISAQYPDACAVPVQHHHAHVLSCVAEHGCTEPVIGVAFDGFGLGHDGAIWGGEILVADGLRCDRAAHLAYVPQPGGDAAAREPWRMAVAHLAAAYGPGSTPADEALAHRVGPAKVAVVRQMVERGISSPPTSSAGRLFDAVAALLGLRDQAAFEGQAAMALEAVATAPGERRYAFDLDTARDPWTIFAAPVIRDVVSDMREGRAVGEISASFHTALAEAIGCVCYGLARRTGIRRVALTGGVFQNARLSHGVAQRLAAANLSVLQHRHVPCNDGGLALGQALFGLRSLKQGRIVGRRSQCA